MPNIVDCTLRRIPLDRAGYDKQGAYWGVGQKVWFVHYDGPCAPPHEMHSFRCSDLQSARAYVRAAVERHAFVNGNGEAPQARFVR